MEREFEEAIEWSEQLKNKNIYVALVLYPTSKSDNCSRHTTEITKELSDLSQFFTVLYFSPIHTLLSFTLFKPYTPSRTRLCTSAGLGQDGVRERSFSCFQDRVALWTLVPKRRTKSMNREGSCAPFLLCLPHAEFATTLSQGYVFVHLMFLQYTTMNGQVQLFWTHFFCVL